MSLTLLYHCFRNVNTETIQKIMSKINENRILSKSRRMLAKLLNGIMNIDPDIRLNASSGFLFLYI